MLPAPHNTKILIIDDNPTLAIVFANLLRTKGFSATTETMLKAGLQYLENESYHAVFVDVPIEGYNEKQILAMLQENQVFQKTNVFLFSGVDVFELDKWKKQGLHSYLKKPVKPSVIIKALEDVRTKMPYTDSQMVPKLVMA